MFNKKSILTFTFLLNFAVLQLNASQIHQKLNSGQVMGTNPQTPLVGEQSESKIVPEYFKFKQSQTRTFEQLPNDLKYVIGQFVGFDQAVNTSSHRGPIKNAIYNHDSDAIQLLIALRADLHDRKREDQDEESTPLVAAIQKYGHDCSPGLGHSEKEEKKTLAIIDYLLNKKIGINKTSRWEEIPIHVAIDYGLLDITQRLITAGADLSLKNDFDDTPLDAAKGNLFIPLNREDRKKRYSICDILEQAGAPSFVNFPPIPTDAQMDQIYHAAMERSKSRNWCNKF